MTRRWIVAVAFAFALASLAQAEPTHPLESAFVAIRELRLEDAERTLAALPRALATRPETTLARATIALYRGRYEEALSSLDEATPRLSGDLAAYAASIRAPIVGAARRTREFETATSTNERYVVRFAPEDRILVPYVLAQLEAADRMLTELLGYRHPGPIRIELFADPEALSDVSTLSVQAIETTGTIAICKFDRLMVTTPRVLSHGYPWATTVNHELVHLLLARATNDRAPTWFHEGVAKFLESSPYYGRAVLALDPAERKIFRDRVLANDILPFDRFHPSVAMLPTPEDAALAYAEAATVASALFAAKGKDGFVSVLHRIGEGVDARVAIGEAMGRPFDPWVNELFREAARVAPVPSAALEVPRFVRGREREDDDSSEVRSPEAARRVRLGDMLWSRRHPLAASREYARAHAIAPDDPVVISRYGRSALEGGDANAAVTAAREALRLHPTHAPARALLAAALARAGDRHGAVLAAYDALRYNPFDPSPHCVLAEVAEDEPTRRRERDACQRLAPESSPSE